MNHRDKQIQRITKKYKHLAAAVVGAVIMSSAMVPGIPAATAHASANPNAGSHRGTTTERNTSANQMENATPTVAGNTPATTSPPNINANPVQPKAVTINPPTTTSPPIVSEKKEVTPVQPKPGTDKPSVTTSAPAEKQQQKKPNPAEKKAQPDESSTQGKQVIEMTATAYAPGAQDNDQWGDKTYMGTQIRPGVIAVDPKIIPLGSRVYIEYPDGHGEYAIAEDTGGAIKGNRIDVAMWSDNKANDFGIQKVKVHVVNTPKNA